MLLWCLLVEFYKTPEGRKMQPDFVDTIFLAIHRCLLTFPIGAIVTCSCRSFLKTTKDFDVAVIGTKWSLQFSEGLSPICMPDVEASDANTCDRTTCNAILISIHLTL